MRESGKKKVLRHYLQAVNWPMQKILGVRSVNAGLQSPGVSIVTLPSR